MIASLSRPDGEPLLELLVAAVGDPRHLRGEALDVLGLELRRSYSGMSSGK